MRISDWSSDVCSSDLRLAQGIRSLGRRPDDRRDGQGLRQNPMALMTFKPTSPGRRAMVRVVTPDLHKGRPHAALVESKSFRFREGRRNDWRKAYVRLAEEIGRAHV